jgi:DNA integrity scanning protein DisA with diadenylate cyclase activity
MEPVSAAASVIAVIQITQTVGVFLRDLYRDIRNARAEIERIYDAVVNLETIARKLDKLAKQQNRVVLDSALLTDPNGPLQQALSELERVKKKLDVPSVEVDGRFQKVKLSISQSRKRSLKWPFEKEEVMNLVVRLESQKTTITLEVGVDTL